MRLFATVLRAWFTRILHGIDRIQFSKDLLITALFFHRLILTIRAHHLHQVLNLCVLPNDLRINTLLLLYLLDHIINISVLPYY